MISLPFSVVFTGSHCTGKTTLARHTDAALRRLGYDLKPILTEVARLVLSERETSLMAMAGDLDARNKYQREVFTRQLREESAREHVGYVADRSALDALAYMAEYGTGLCDLVAQYMPMLSADYLPRLRRRSLVFFVRPHRAVFDGPGRADGVRSVGSWDETVGIDRMIKFMLELWDVPRVEIATPNMAERVRQIEAAIKGWTR